MLFYMKSSGGQEKQLMKHIIIAASLLFILFGCGGNKERSGSSNLLEVTHLFQDSLPQEYQNILNRYDDTKQKIETILVIPSKVVAGEPLHIDLYGLWDSQGDYLICPYGSFKKLVIDQNQNNQLKLHLKKDSKLESPCPGAVPRLYFALRHSYDINGSWEPGVLKVIIENPGVMPSLEMNVTVLSGL